ncbi:ATP-binding protein [Fibrobacterota bacterium]
MKESQNIEYKSSWRDEYIKWISGFANAQGGRLYIGKDDNGKVVGVTNADKLMEDIPNKVRDLLGIMVDVNLKKGGNKNFLEICVEPYPNPISHKGRYYYRSGSTRQELKGAALDRFLLRKQGKHWDGVPVPHVKTGQLNPAVLRLFGERALKSRRLDKNVLSEKDRALIEKLHLFDGKYLKRAALLLFHSDPEKFITGAYIKIGFFRDNANLLYHDEIHGDLFSQVDKTMDLLTTKYLKAVISYQGIQRVEEYQVPDEALRETVLNAVTHKDYSSATPIQISVYDHKIMVWNPGQLPPDWTVKNLKEKHSSQPFNPDIANVFFRAGMVESWGRGIERILADCKNAGLKEPVFKYESTGLWVEYQFPSVETLPLTGKSSQPATPDTTQETTQETTPEKILSILRKQPTITRKAIAEKIGITPDGVKYHLNKLKSEGIITHTGPTKAGKWKILK